MKRKNLLKPILYYALIFSSILFFSEPISDFIDILFVQPIFSKISRSIVSDVSVFTLTLVLSYLILKSRDHKWVIRLITIFLLLFLIFRLAGHWTYTKLYLLPIAYADFIALPSIPLLSFHIYYSLKNTSRKRKPKKLGFLEDNAIELIKDDTYERNVVAKELAKQITYTNNEKAFAIGIVGSYGSGKTSFINLISDTLSKDESAPLTIKFNPWDAGSPKEIQKLFFDEISFSFAKENRDLSSSLYNYYRRLNGKTTILNNLITYARDFSLILERDLDDEKAKINNMMSSFSRKVLVFIDDLDRLHKKELIEVLRLIRNTANFKNIIYIVAYDKSYIEHSIKKLNVNSNYLDKIFQVEIPLPKAESFLRTKTLLEKLEPIIMPDELSYLQQNFIPLHFDSEFEESVGMIFKNNRDIIRFINAFKLAYNIISKEVDFVQLFYLQLLSFKYTPAYDMLYERRHEVLKAYENTLYYRSNYSLRTLSGDHGDDYLILDLLKNNLSKDDKTIIQRILKHLFSFNLTLNYKDKVKTIANPDFFDLFFTNRIPSIGISEEEFRKSMFGDKKEVEEYIALQVKMGKSTQLIRRILKMDAVDFKNRESYENILYTFIKLVMPMYNKERHIRDFHFNRFILVNFTSQEFIFKKYYNWDSKSFGKHLTTLFSYFKESYIFLSELCRRLILELSNTPQFPTNKFLQTQLDCLIEGLDKSSIITPQTTWMFWGIRQYNTDTKEQLDHAIPSDESWYIHPEAVEILQHRISNKDLTHFITSLISKKADSEDRYGLHDKLIKDVFKDHIFLRYVISNNKFTDDNIKKEFLSFMSIYIENNGFIEYDFKYISLDH